jgi:hypothetical protein
MEEDKAATRGSRQSCERFFRACAGSDRRQLLKEQRPGVIPAFAGVL